MRGLLLGIPLSACCQCNTPYGVQIILDVNRISNQESYVNGNTICESLEKGAR